MMIMMASTPTSAIEPAVGAELHLDHFAERLAVAADRREQHDEVLHRAGDHDAGKNPQRAGQEAHLRRQHRADQRAGAGDRREVVSEQHPPVGGHVVHPVVVALGRRLPRVVQPQDLVGDEFAVEPIGDEVDADRGGHQPDRADVLAAAQCERGKRKRADDGYHRPQQHGRDLVHDTSWVGPTLEIAFHSTANHLRQAGRLRQEPAAQSFSNQEMSLNPRFETRKTRRNATAFES